MRPVGRLQGLALVVELVGGQSVLPSWHLDALLGFILPRAFPSLGDGVDFAPPPLMRLVQVVPPWCYPGSASPPRYRVSLYRGGGLLSLESAVPF
jgi:hypothetical protein